MKAPASADLEVIAYDDVLASVGGSMLMYELVERLTHEAFDWQQAVGDSFYDSFYVRGFLS